MDSYGVLGYSVGSGTQGKVERYCCNIILGAPTTVGVQGMRGDEMN